MAEEHATGNREMGNIDSVRAYDILLKHHREENRLLSERTVIFLAASYILTIRRCCFNFHDSPLSWSVVMPSSSFT